MVSNCSDLEPENKKIKCEDESTEEEIPSFYSYKSARPIVKSLCLSSPGLCSPRKPVTRNGRLPQDLKEILEQKLVDVEDIDADSSDEEFEESIFLTPLRKKTKCLSSPGLCNNFPKVTKRSFPSSIGKLIDEAQELEERFESTDFEEIDAHSSDEEFEHSLSTEYTSEENGNSIFDLEVRFSKP